MADDEIFGREINSLHKILNEGNVEEVHKLRQSKIFLSLLLKYRVELITKVSTFLDDRSLYKCPDVVRCYEEILQFIVEDINPEDSFVTLLEQLDEENCCIEKFLTLLTPLKYSLAKFSTRGYWLEWTLSTIICYLENLNYPEDYEIVFDEKKMMVNDPYVDTVLQLSEKLLDFHQKLANDTISACKVNALVVFGFQILAKPMMYLYLEKFTRLKQVCNQIVLSIEKLYGNGYYLFEFIDEMKALDLKEFDCDSNICLIKDDAGGTFHRFVWDKVKILPLAVYYSVLIVDMPFTMYFPLVYHPLYLFHKLFYLTVLLMKHQHNAVVRKGLLLCHHIFQSIPKGFIPYWYLEYRVHRKFVNTVSRVSIYSYILENRKLAIELLQVYVHKFDVKGTYLLLMNITSETNSEDIDSEIITIFRKAMHKSFIENNFQFYQKGKYLIDLLNIFANLSENSDADLIASKNKIISFLHLFALILGRDVQNQTTVRDSFVHFDRNYFTVVKAALKKSREKYKRDASSFINDEDDVSIVVEGESLPKLQREEKIQAIKNALNALNMIEHAMELVYEYT